MPDSKTKKDNFIRLAEARTNKIINMIDLLANLSNKSNYSYTQDQVQKIFASIEDSIQEAKSKFNDEPKEKKRKFRL